MIIGHIVGKVNTNEFCFSIRKEINKFEYLQVHHDDCGFVLCQIVDIEKTEKASIAKCIVLGYKDEAGKIQRLGSPFNPGSEVLAAQPQFIAQVISPKKSEDHAYLGKLSGQDIAVYLDLNKILTKHLAVLAKSGSGKSYTVGVLIEEIVRLGIPIIVIDPHGEYSLMKLKNDRDKEALALFEIEAKGISVTEYGDPTVSRDAIPLRLHNNLSSHELVHLLPGKVNSNQLGLLYNALKHTKRISFSELLLELEREENSAKWGLINVISYLDSLGIFSESAPPYQELLCSGKVTTINLKGYAPDVQEIIVYKLCQDLFDLRKKNKVPPFFLVIEEAHNYCPERSFGEAKCSKIMRTIASEGRKFGLGLCVISQRPARIDKSVLSQCSTQIIQKITNPHDLKAVSSSVEGLTLNLEKEIQNLPVGTALVTGVTDLPLFTRIRPRMSAHGGRSVEMIADNSFKDKLTEFDQQELLPLILPKISKKDIKLMNEENNDIKTMLLPAALLDCEEKGRRYKLLVELITGSLVREVDNYTLIKIPDLHSLSSNSLILLKKAHRIKRFSKSIAEPGAAAKLLERGLLKQTHDQYIISDEHAFLKLSNYQTFEKPEYVKIAYDEKLELKVSVASVRQKLKLFINVMESTDCFIVRYCT